MKRLLPIALVLASCASEGSVEPIGESCAEPLAESTGRGAGVAWSFFPDPIVASRDPWLSPVSVRLDEYRNSVELEALDGTGVLRGTRLEVRNILACDGGFNAFSAENEFLYSHDEQGFQEAMTYHAGNAYLSFLESAGIPSRASRTVVYAHCMLEDNAFFIRSSGDGSGGSLHEVCLGNSTATPGASYADDGAVVVHELQHGSTLEAYSEWTDLNRLWVDEAGALNEGISDFLALVFMDPRTDAALDPRVFSRWALGQFVPGLNVARGAHRCPAYDPGYPECGGYASGAAGFSADEGRVSFSYPDGVGWPYANNFVGPGYLRDIHQRWTNIEEIHNNGVVATGALWDAYEALRMGAGLSREAAGAKMAFAVHAALELLPLPDEQQVSPVTMPAFADAFVQAIEAEGTDWTADERELVRQALAARGLLDFVPVAEGWARVGAGTETAPGLLIEDNAVTLRSHAASLGGSSDMIPSTLRVNGRLDPGEWAIVWFDLENNSPRTAGAVRLHVESLDPRLEILDASWNIGAVSSGAQVQYFKIHGTDVAAALASDDPAMDVPVRNDARGGRSSYFLTNPFFSKDARTGVWIRADESLNSGDVVVLRVVAQPSNGEATTVDFPVEIP